MGLRRVPSIEFILKFRHEWYLMPFLCFTVVLVGLNLSMYASDTLPVLKLTDTTTYPMILGYGIGVLPMQEEAQIPPEEILRVPDSLFFPAEVRDQIPEHYNAWIKFTLENTSEEIINHFVTFSYWHKELDVYTGVDELIYLREHTGSDVPPSNRMVPIDDPMFFIHLEPGNQKTFFIRSRLMEDGVQGHYYDLLLHADTFGFIKNLIFQSSLSSLFGGVLIVFAAVSLLMFLSFREWLFMYFTFLLISLTIYLLDDQGVLHYVIDLPQDFRLAYINSISVAGIKFFSCMFISAYLGLKIRNRKLYYSFVSVAVTASLVSLSHYYLSGGLPIGYDISNSLGALYLIYMLVIVLYFYFRRVREAGVLLISISLLLLGGLTYTLSLLALLPYHPLFFNSFQIGALAFSGNLLYGLFDRIKTIQQDRMRFQLEGEKSDELLFNVLPKEVASELKEKGVFEAREFERVSVLFTDFKDFTATASGMTARELVREINDCFMAFDRLMDKYNLEKIKTIGDSYMAAAGFSGDARQKSINLVRAALEMQQFIHLRKSERHALKKAGFDMRAGIHTGPVVAGIVGEKKFQYDIWGDTVNTASRMESKGEIGRVNISKQTYELIADCPDFSFEKREAVEVKGKGVLEMWFVSLAVGF